MEGINYSIIIPHKNTPQLLQRCLDSIPQREDVQVIVIDDNSSPDIVEFARFPGNERDDILAVFTKESKGGGYARNKGLKHARGKWLLFADADDFFLPGFLTALDAYCDTDYDLITFCAESVKCYTLESVPSRQNKDVAEDVNPDLLKYRNDVPWAKMVSARLVQEHHIRFDETPAANDTMFSARVDYYARKVTVCSASVYCATLRSDSLRHAQILTNILARVLVSCRLNRFLETIGRKDKYVYSYRWVTVCRKHFGQKGYLKGLLIWLCHERWENIYKTFSDLLKAKFRR